MLQHFGQEARVDARISQRYPLAVPREVGLALEVVRQIETDVALSGARCRQQQRPVGLVAATDVQVTLICDVINAAGDVVIRSVAECLQDCVRPMDLVARVGGEEFCVVLPRTAQGPALRIAEKLRALVGCPVRAVQPPLLHLSPLAWRLFPQSRRVHVRPPLLPRA